MNPPPRNSLALCIAAALGATWTNAAAPPSRPPAPLPPPVNALIAAPPGVISGPPLILAPNAPGPLRHGLTGPAPTGIAVSGMPLVASLSWNAMPGAQRYAVYRLDGANLSVEVTPTGFTGIQFQDVVPDPHITYRYVRA